MKRIKQWLVCYIIPLAVLAGISWLIWQQKLLGDQVQQHALTIESLNRQLKSFRTPKLIQDENKHYQQLAYLVLVDRSDLDLGAAYLSILKANYSEVSDRKHLQSIKTLSDQLATLRAQVKQRTELITDLQAKLSKPGRVDEDKTNKWLRPLKGWIHVEYHQGQANAVDPQQWRYWSALEQARWYLVHGHYNEYMLVIQNIQNWAKLYPGNIDWSDTLTTLSAPFEPLDLSVLTIDIHQAIQVHENVLQRQRLTVPKKPTTTNEKTNDKAQSTPAKPTHKPHQGVIA